MLLASFWHRCTDRVFPLEATRSMISLKIHKKQFKDEFRWYSVPETL